MMGKKLYSLIGAVILVGTGQSFAIQGGPWDHLGLDTFSNSNADGLYQASVTLQNGSGVVRFSQSSERENLADVDLTALSEFAQILSQTGTTAPTTLINNTTASQSNSVIFVEGQAYFGNSFGFVDLGSGSVGGGTTGQSNIVADVNQSAQGAAQNLNAVVDITGLSETLSMFFEGKITKRFPQVRFSAKGTASLFSKPGVVVVPPTGANSPAVIRPAENRSVTTTITSTQTDNRTVSDSTGGAIPGTAFTTANGQTGNLSFVDTDNRTVTTSDVNVVNVNQAVQADNQVDVRLFGGRISRTAQLRLSTANAAAAQQ